MIAIREFKTSISGFKLLIFGAIHGNEICGPCAMSRVIADLESGTLKLQRGGVTFVPVCNPRAYSEKVRYVEENLNRVFRPSSIPETYEQKIANDLCPLIDRYDILLDIHSTTAAGPPTVFIDFPTPENRAFAGALGASYALVGWPELYSRDGWGITSYDTLRYAHGVDKITALIECGQHDDPDACNFAESVIHRALAHFNLIEEEFLAVRDRKEIIMTKIFLKQHYGDHLLKPWRHLESIPTGSVIAQRQLGEKIIAQDGNIMIMPNDTAKVGEEWFYLGVLK